MAYDLEEQEQIDELRAFWTRWGSTITIALTVVLFAFAGWRAWGWWQLREAGEAAVINERLGDALRRNQLDEAAPLAASLMKEHARSAFAPLAALRIAKAQSDAGDAKAARMSLEWAAEHGDDAAVRGLARVRLAGIDLDDGRQDDGLKRLEGEPPAELAGLWLDRRGDLLAAAGRRDDARAAWGDALKRLEPNSPLRPVVQLKLDALGGGA